MIPAEARALLYKTREGCTSRIDEIIAKYGLDRPFYEQYPTWLSQVLQGNLGISKSTANQPVLSAMLNRFPATLELVMFSVPLIMFFGFFLGLESALHKDKLIDRFSRALATIGLSLPSFWLGILLIAVFFGVFSLFPPARLAGAAAEYVNSPAWHRYTGFLTIDGLLNGQFWITMEALRHLVLPTVVMTVSNAAILIFVIRSGSLEVLKGRFLAGAKVKGHSQNEASEKYAYSVAQFPATTFSVLFFSSMLFTLIMTETVFSFPGIGQFTAIAALTGPDVMAVIGVALFTGTIFVVLNLIVELTHAIMVYMLNTGGSLNIFSRINDLS